MNSMTEQQSQREYTFKQLYDACKTHECKCGTHLPENTMKSFSDLSNDPTYGYKIKRFKTLQWVWLECPKCGYQNALWKLGCPL